MPYSSQHKLNTRIKIIESARILFNRHGFQDVTIDMVMKNAGVTRGGFYNHFKSKESLYGAAIESFLNGRGAIWREEAGVNPKKIDPDTVSQMIESYLSAEHLGDLDGQCPMIALPSDIARSNPEVQSSYQDLLSAMVSLFESSLRGPVKTRRQKALSIAALCVGGMVLARTLPDSKLSEEVRQAAQLTAHALVSPKVSKPRQ